MENREEILTNTITEVVNQFKFPDGCLDLDSEEQENFIETLVKNILKKLKL